MFNVRRDRVEVRRSYLERHTGLRTDMYELAGEQSLRVRAGEQRAETQVEES